MFLHIGAIIPTKAAISFTDNRLGRYQSEKTTKLRLYGGNIRAEKERSPKCTARSGSSTLTVFNGTSQMVQRHLLASTPATLSLLQLSWTRTGMLFQSGSERILVEMFPNAVGQSSTERIARRLRRDKMSRWKM